MAATLEIDHGAGRGSGLVGRAREIELFAVAFGRMLDGQRQILTLAGEPGIGKTRLAAALAESAEDRGGLVLWGRCYEEPGAPPYWPWVQILREFVQASSPDELRLLVGVDAAPIAALVPELGQALDVAGTAGEPPPEPGAARFRAFDAIAGFFRRAAEKVPLVLIVDNAHWADPASLALLEFLSQELDRSRLLVVCTYRDTEISRANPLLGTLGVLGGGEGVAHLKLRGLDRAGIASLAGQVLAAPLPSGIIEAIDEQTDGNPLFVIELLKILIEESRDAGIEPIEVRIPDGVRATIGRRLNRLPDDVNAMLRAASVIGRDFESAVLARIAGREAEAVLGALHLAERAGFVERRDDDVLTHRFLHALIRETLYDEIPTPDRLRLHGLTGDALVELYPELPQRQLSRIAHHYFESAPLGRASQAAEYAGRAGAEAMRLDAYEAAVGHYGHVISLLEQQGQGGSDRMRQAILFKSRALLGTGDIEGAVGLLVGAIAERDPGCDAEYLAEVVTQWVVLRSHTTQVEQLPVLRNVLELLPDGDGAARAKVLGALAFAERTLGNRARVDALTAQSLAMARRLGGAQVLGHCLRSALYALAGIPEHLEQRLALTAEFLTVAWAGNQCEGSAEASYLRSLALIDAGRIAEFERQLDDYESLGGARVGLHEHRTRALRIVLALLHGEYDGLEQQIEQLRSVGRKTLREDADGVYGAQMFALNRDLGRLPAFAPLIEGFAASPIRRAWTPGLMLALTEIGRLDAARREFERLADRDFAAIPNDNLRAVTLVYCAETCAALGDSARAGTLYTLIEPFGAGFASHPTAVCLGSTELYLGMLAGTMGRADLARQHFERAARANSAARAWPWLARTWLHFAAALGASDRPEDRRRADSLLREAEQLAGSLGMRGLVAAIDDRLRGPAAAADYPDELTAREVDVLRLLAIGRSNKDIAKVLSISLNTVATHVRNILTKTDCANRTEAAAYASRNRLSDPN